MFLLEMNNFIVFKKCVTHNESVFCALKVINRNI